MYVYNQAMDALDRIQTRNISVTKPSPNLIMSQQLD